MMNAENNQQAEAELGKAQPKMGLRLRLEVVGEMEDQVQDG